MIAIIKYNAGNIKSVENAIMRLGFECIVTDKAQELKGAEKIIFPGVGEAHSAMKYLEEKNLSKLIPRLEQPFLGICLGLQLMCHESEEGQTKGLGIFNTKVKKFPPGDIVPHMGWNNSTTLRGSLFNRIPADSDFFYVHSYYAELCTDSISVCDYIVPFSAALHKNNFYAVQFHPEKSADAGEQLLSNFLNI
jgi:imidazole glycerol-phosphate synthase subunit HisH